MNLNDLKKRASELAQAGATRSRQLATAAKLKAANLGEEDAIRKAYIELGKQYFAMYGEHPEEEFAAACTIIKEAQATIAANNATIEDMKATDAAEEIVQDAEEAAEEVKDAAKDVVDEVKEAAEDVAEKAADAVEDAVEDAPVEEIKEAVEEIVKDEPATEEPEE